MARAHRMVRFEPLGEEVGDLQRQPQHHIAGVAGARGGGRFEHALQVLVRQRRNDRGHDDSGRNARRGKLRDGLDPARRGVGARLHRARDIRIQRCHGNEDFHQPLGRHRRQDVDVPGHQARLRRDADRVFELPQHLQQRARELQLPFRGLVRFRIGAEGDHRSRRIGSAQFLPKQFGRVGFGEDLGLEVQARRQPEIGVARPGIAVDAAVLATAVRIDRLVERQVRRAVGRYDRPRDFDPDLCGRGAGRLVRVDFDRSRVGFMLHPVEAGFAIGHRSAALPYDWVRLLRIAGRVCHGSE